MFLGLGVVLGLARLFGEIARRFHQPAVIGEILAGVVLGPSLFGLLAPDAQAWMFPRLGAVATARSGIEMCGVALFLLVAGMEVDLRVAWRQGRTSASVSTFGMAVPFGLGLLCGHFAPEAFGRSAGADPTVFTLFLATAMGISALPVIARTLLDLELLRTEFGMTVLAAAIVDDLCGWMVFAVILSMLGHEAVPWWESVALIVGFVTIMLTVVRWAVHRALLLIQAYASYPGGILGFVMSFALLCAACTESFGVHAVFGTFFAGVTLGASRNFPERPRATIEQFVTSILAPLFFGGVGLKVNFVTAFDLQLAVAVVAIACIGKLLGAGLGALLAGVPARQAGAIGFAMNARGAMEIILGLLALQSGVIDERMFVALVIVALVTSMIAGPFIQALLSRKRAARFFEFLSPNSFVPSVAGETADAVIAALSHRAAQVSGLDRDQIERAVVAREQQMPTGLPDGLAVPQARLEGLKRPVVVVGTHDHGVDFGAPDGVAARVVFLVLTPAGDADAQIELIADISRTFHRGDMRERLLTIRSYTEFVALSRTGAAA